MKKKTKKKTNKEQKSYLLIDGEGLLHQSFHKFSNLMSRKAVPTGAIFGFFKSLHHYMYRFQCNDVYVVFDNGHSKHRDSLLPTYKEHRKRVDIDYESLQAQKKKIMAVCRMLRIKYIFDKEKSCNYEGDDFLAYLTLKYLPRKSKIVIVTADKDFNQLLRGQTVKIFNPRKDQLVFESNCKTIYGYKSSETVDWLSLIGDTSDDIPGYKGIGEKKARQFLDTYGSIEAYLAQDQCLSDDKGHTKMLEVYNRNKQLIDLKWYVNHIKLDKLPLKDYKDSVIQEKKLKKFSDEHNLDSFNTDIFKRTFIEQLEGWKTND